MLKTLLKRAMVQAKLQTSAPKTTLAQLKEGRPPRVSMIALMINEMPQVSNKPLNYLNLDRYYCLQRRRKVIEKHPVLIFKICLSFKVMMMIRISCLETQKKAIVKLMSQTSQMRINPRQTSKFFEQKNNQKQTKIDQVIN